MKARNIKVAMIFTLLLASCGKDKKYDAPVVTMDGVPMPLPKVDPNRPKTGKGAFVDVPWVIPSKIKSEKGALFRPFLYVTGNDYHYSYLCGTVVDGKPKWIKPTAYSPVEWGDGYFDVLNSNEAKESVGNWSCTARAFEGVHYFEVLDNGETLKLSFEGDEPETYKILRN